MRVLPVTHFLPQLAGLGDCWGCEPEHGSGLLSTAAGASPGPYAGGLDQQVLRQLGDHQLTGPGCS